MIQPARVAISYCVLVVGVLVSSPFLFLAWLIAPPKRRPRVYCAPRNKSESYEMAREVLRGTPYDPRKVAD